MLPKTTNNFTLTPDYGMSSSQQHTKFSLKDSGFDAKTLGELGTLFPDGYDEYEFNEDDIDLIEDPQQELQDMFFGMKDFENFDAMSDQTMADSINNIGTMVLGNIEKNMTRSNSEEPDRIKTSSSITEKANVET